MLRMVNLMTVWLIRLEGEKRSRSLAVLAAFSSFSPVVTSLFFLSSSSASFEMPLNGLPRSMERNELWEKRFTDQLAHHKNHHFGTCLLKTEHWYRIQGQVQHRRGRGGRQCQVQPHMLPLQGWSLPPARKNMSKKPFFSYFRSSQLNCLLFEANVVVHLENQLLCLCSAQLQLVGALAHQLDIIHHPDSQQIHWIADWHIWGYWVQIASIESI